MKNVTYICTILYATTVECHIRFYWSKRRLHVVPSVQEISQISKSNKRYDNVKRPFLMSVFITAFGLWWFHTIGRGLLNVVYHVAWLCENLLTGIQLVEGSRLFCVCDIFISNTSFNK